MVNFAAADVNGLVRIIKRKLKKIQYRPRLDHPEFLGDCDLWGSWDS